MEKVQREEDGCNCEQQKAGKVPEDGGFVM
jgi:hypothetical protein